MTKQEFLAQVKEAVVQQRQFGKQLQMLSEKQLKMSLEENKWCVAEILDHVAVTNQKYIKNIEAAIEKSPKKLEGDKGKFKAGLFGRIFGGLVGPQNPRSMKAPKTFLPAKTINLKGKDAVAKFIRTSNKLNDLLKQLEDKNINKLRVKSPAKSWVKFRLGAAIQVMIAHQARHLMQIKDILEHPRFPKQSTVQHFGQPQRRM